MSQVNCRQTVESLLGYLDDALAPAARHAVEQHLATCDRCVVYARDYQRAVHLARTAFDDHPSAAPQPLPPELVTAIVVARRGVR